MLACARIGATHNVVFGGFASKELSVRIDASKPRVIIAGSNGVLPGKTVAFQPIIDKAIEMSDHKPQYTIYKNRSSEVRAQLSACYFSYSDISKFRLGTRVVATTPAKRY